jgi:uncharacterized protein YndB with AHSA1/START domain
VTIRKSVTVRCPQARAFALFTREVGSWWPLTRGFSRDGERANEIFIEDREGGRFYERFTDGSEAEIGRVIRCEPPSLIAFTFTSPAWDAVTEVEVRFTAASEGTRVDLEHRGFEISPQMQARSERFAEGWSAILGYYVENANS